MGCPTGSLIVLLNVQYWLYSMFCIITDLKYARCLRSAHVSHGNFITAHAQKKGGEERKAIGNSLGTTTRLITQ